MIRMWKEFFLQKDGVLFLMENLEFGNWQLTRIPHNLMMKLWSYKIKRLQKKEILPNFSSSSFQKQGYQKPILTKIYTAK